ncbi:hypothetical protein [Brevundimonas sp. SL130]|uniref:hypothetical protein n=1 Tax=Brevundimonas sp. SL130 TaxID=2995143 RepID=UPI00226CB6AE|nr:hypothetical protein [Brevundimonas sp. SL130]WAC60705.1 hypothetical protein OU998_04450 [Brevundimonas sp. SL130]
MNPRATYFKMRHWVDAQLSSESRHVRERPFIVSLIILFIPALLGWAPFVPRWAVSSSLVVAAAFWVSWIAFVGWRAARLIRASNYKSARDYDRRGKFLLPPEYAASESYMSHKRRSRKAKP